MRSFVLVALIAALSPPPAAADPVAQGAPNADYAPAFPGQTRADALPPTPVAVETFAEGLDSPWGIAPLPDGGWLVTERSGALRRLGPDGAVSPPVAGVPEVDARRQGGLLDVMTGPDFADTRRVWLTYAKPVEGGTVTAAATGVLSADGARLEEVRDIFLQTPPSPTPMHYGSRIVLAPDGASVFITTGEHSAARERVLAQDLGTTYGKVVRVDPLTGAALPSNPFVGQDGDDTIWSYGHRNPQGAALDAGGRLWVVEHGARGGDEINRVEKGANYGWPVIAYGRHYSGLPIGQGTHKPGMEQPELYWDPSIAPSGMMIYSGKLWPDWRGHMFVGSLKFDYIARVSGRPLREVERIAGPETGRVRDVREAPDGTIWFLSVGRGALYRIAPAGD